MSKRKHGLGLLGLFAVTALGMMAFASSALAVAEPAFNVNGVKATEALDAQFTGAQEGVGTLSIPGLNTEINCTEGEIAGGLIKDGLDAKIAKILFKGCSVLVESTKAEIKTCIVSDVHAGAPASLHVTALNPLFLPVEFAAGHFGVLAEKISVFINMIKEIGCTLPIKTEVKGEVCFLISDTPVKTNDTVEPLLLTNKTIQKSCPKKIVLEGPEKLPVGGTFEDKLLYGAQEAFLTGAAKLKLIAPHVGLPFGVLLLL